MNFGTSATVCLIEGDRLIQVSLYFGFHLSSKTNSSKFQFNLKSTDTLNEFIRTPKCFVGKQITIYNLQVEIKERKALQYLVH